MENQINIKEILLYKKINNEISSIMQEFAGQYYSIDEIANIVLYYLVRVYPFDEIKVCAKLISQAIKKYYNLFSFKTG
jgi:hypothetical protein